MDTVLLFRKRPSLTDDHLPWLRCTDDHLCTDRYFSMSLNSHLDLVFELQAAKIAAGREIVSQNFSVNPDPQEKPVSVDDITPSQEQQTLPDRLRQSLIEWLAPKQEKARDTSLISPWPFLVSINAVKHKIAQTILSDLVSGEGGCPLHGR